MIFEDVFNSCPSWWTFFLHSSVFVTVALAFFRLLRGPAAAAVQIPLQIPALKTTLLEAQRVELEPDLWSAVS